MVFFGIMMPLLRGRAARFPWCDERAGRESTPCAPRRWPAGGRYAVLELNEAPGYRTPPHVHPGMDESFYVLEGTLELEVGGTTHTLAAGSYVHIPRGTPHAQGSADDLPVKLLTTFTPGGFEAFFLDRVELARTVRRGDEEFLPRMMDVVHRHGAWLQPAQ